MHLFRKLPRKAIVLAALCSAFVLSAVGASTASAIEWTQGEKANMTWVKPSLSVNTLSLTGQKGTPVTCSSSSNLTGETWAGGGGNITWTWWLNWLSCPNSKKLEIFHDFEALESLGGGKYLLEIRPATFEGQYSSPFGSYWTNEVGTMVFTNGNATTPSTITFNETVLGMVSSKYLLVSGTVQVKTGAGGLLTLTGE